jgi:mannose-1-phosphate guanylyltransferase/mannose-1-phosphate guanylyltransferase/mannose-6-phosphate isomerase
MLQATTARAANRALFAPPLVIANAEHRFLIAEQIRATNSDPCRIVLEPQARNTAAAAVVAALIASHTDPDALILLMPADHVIDDAQALETAVELGAEAARSGAFVLFGIPPRVPETGYGYIRAGQPLLDAPGVYDALEFTEKPDRADAERYVASGEYYWNSGIFLLPARAFLDEVARLAPDILAACRAALELAQQDLDFLRLDQAAFARCPAVSIDYAIMEKTDRAAVVPVTFEWSDVGAWSAVWDLSQKDAHGNVAIGDTVLHEVRNCYVRGDRQVVAALGVSDLIIVATGDAILVASKDSDQDVKKIVDQLKTGGREIATETQRVHRPWGYYESIERGDRYQVKRINVAPGAKLSLQRHFHRAEHWVVVHGTALVTRDGESILLRENESVFLPLGCVHRLENPGKIPLDLIEIQSGAYLGEDDIVRLDDVYART